MTQENRTVRILLVGVAVAMALGLSGCGKKPAGESKANGAKPDSALASYENPTAVPHPSPPQPQGPQVGRSDPLLNSSRTQLAEWAAMWGHALEGFSLDSLWLVRRGHWSPGGGSSVSLSMGGADADPQDDLATVLLSLQSPDSRYTLVVDSYQVVIPGEDTMIVGGEPDSRCSLLDRRDSTELVLGVTGTGGGYHWGCWLSNTDFAVGDWNDSDESPQWKQGGLSLYSIRDSSVSVYVTRFVSSETYQRYEDAWHGWLLRRYRAWKRSHRPA